MKERLDLIDAADAIGATLHGSGSVAVVTILTGPDAGRRLLIHASETGPDLIDEIAATGSLGSPELDRIAQDLGHRTLSSAVPLMEEAMGLRLYAEAHHPREELVIVGAGHIAVPLADVGVQLGYHVTLLDDREEFATTERFPDEARVIRIDLADPFRDLRIGRHTHLVLVTRAHKYDYDCLLHLLRADTKPAYIGMIGSRRRVRATFQALLEAGIDRERIAAVRAPVGLEIGAETPAEIAISIAAELVMLRRGVLETGPIRDRERVLHRLIPEGSHG